MSNTDLQRTLPRTKRADESTINDYLSRPETILRTDKSKDRPFLQIDLQAVEDRRLKGFAREIHLLLLSKFDRWKTEHLAKWLCEELGCTIRTVYYALATLRKHRYLIRINRPVIDHYGVSKWVGGYQIFEVAYETAEDFNPMAHQVSTARKACDSQTGDVPGVSERRCGTTEVRPFKPQIALEARQNAPV